MSDRDLQDRLELAVEAALAAGKGTLERFEALNYTIETKGDGSPVTTADRECEQHLRRLITAKFPRDAILGEEFEGVAGDSGFRWILDPIDGTKSFVRGVPLYAVLVGIERRGEPVAGVINVPGLHEHVYAAKGSGAWHCRGVRTTVPALVSPVASLADSAVLTTSPGGFWRRGGGEAFAKIVDASAMVRGWSDAYGFLLVATGRAEAMIEGKVSIWDLAAVAPVIEEAGGRFTDWKGRRTIEGGDCIASNALVHDALLGHLGPR